MHALLAKSLGLAVKNWRKHYADARRQADRLAPHIAALQNYQSQTIAGAMKDFLARPDAERLENLLEVESRKDAAFRVSQSLSQQRQAIFEAALLDGGREKLAAACDEADAELVAQQASVTADDAARSEKLGEHVVSENVFARIASLRAKLAEARRAAGGPQFGQAVSHLASVIGNGAE